MDIKPENILVSSNGEVIKLADFGSACLTDPACHPNTLYHTTRWWRDPSVLLEMPFSTASDMWSFAAVLVEIFTGEQPFMADSEKELIAVQEYRLEKPYSYDFIGRGSFEGQRKYMQKETPWYINPRKSPTLAQMLRNAFQEKGGDPRKMAQFNALISAAFQYEPERRPIPAEVLAHPFLRKSYDTDIYI